jgi:hypothetical protein
MTALGENMKKWLDGKVDSWLSTQHGEEGGDYSLPTTMDYIVEQLKEEEEEGGLGEYSMPKVKAEVRKLIKKWVDFNINQFKKKRVKKGSGKPIMMSHGQFVKEHKNLVKVLESGTPAQQRKEAQEQRAELKARGGKAPWRYANKAPAFFYYK